jgi:hypothetical protein
MMFFAFKIIKAIDPSQSLGQLLFQDFASVNNVINGLKAGLPNKYIARAFTKGNIVT